jgi:hypothetical protein
MNGTSFSTHFKTLPLPFLKTLHSPVDDFCWLKRRWWVVVTIGGRMTATSPEYPTLD